MFVLVTSSKIQQVGQAVLRPTTSTLKSNLFFIKNFCIVIFGLIVFTPQIAHAIPSPELVIGSVSSLSQVLSLGFAAATGIFALVARRFGYSGKTEINQSKSQFRTIVALMLIVSALGALNIFQYRSQKSEETAKLQATLLRPAEFDGTRIQDPNLHETSYLNQVENPLAISTEEAQRLLETATDNAEVAFFDVRETAENRMGTLPGAAHVRFPDFLQSNIPLDGKKVVLFCHNGNRSSETCAELAARGIDCRFIAGGIEKWIVEGRSFSDSEVTSLSDLRAIPDYPHKDKLLNTDQFSKMTTDGNLQVVDTRYPGEFEIGHLPGAINIPLRALSTSDLKQRIAQLKRKPTVAACYDRRSCFMAQVLGLEMYEAGIDFQGRYTVPWEYFVAPDPKPHVKEWMADQQITYWQNIVNRLADILVWFDQRWHLVVGILVLSLASRILVLPIAVKSERDQLLMARHSEELKALKGRLKNDPIRKTRAIKQFYVKLGLTPTRNLIALLFLPVMMLGLSATEMASASVDTSFLWIKDLSQPDTTLALPILFSFLAGIYLLWAAAKNRRKLVWWICAVPVIFALVYHLSAAGNIYLCIGMVLLLVQRAGVTGLAKSASLQAFNIWQRWKARNLPLGVFSLYHTEALKDCGNKSLRLSVLKNAGLPVPDGLVVRSEAIQAFRAMSQRQRSRFSSKIWRGVGKNPCAVRSSASGEDGSDHSFAGVFESVLDVRRASLCNALDIVIESFSSERAKSYEAENHHSHAGNILVQQMVRSQYAGVLFTQDPTAPGLMMVELVKGCGDDLVSGRVTPQCLRYGRYTHTAASDEAAPIDLEPLLKLGKQIEEIFGCPQDIEWAFCDDTFHIVQSRDITTLTCGDPTEPALIREWSRIFERFKDAKPDSVILEQDEMSEVLPQATPLSFSLMGKLWGPGGSVDLACRQLGVSYRVPEGCPGHLIDFFGRTYVDRELKQQMALLVTNGQARQLRRQARFMIKHFRVDTMATLEEEMAIWTAIDFSALPQKNLIACIEKLQNKLVHEIYVEAEKINILAGFTLREANALAVDDEDALSRLMNPVLRHSPVCLIDACARLTDDSQKDALMMSMGHRSVFDYELSAPRYREAPNLLWALLESAQPPPFKDTCVPLAAPACPIDLAVEFQDLKELGKHEALRIVAEIRRAVLALAEKTELGDLVFNLEMDEVLSLASADHAELKCEAQRRKERREKLLKAAPKNATLTLRECEILSTSAPMRRQSDKLILGGTCVSGSQSVSGRVFLVQHETSLDGGAFEGFEDGDIIVSRMISPAWLPYVQRSGGVLSEVGGWLSHMAIVAREKGIFMQVGCSGLDGLQDRITIYAGIDGSISILDTDVIGNRKTA